MVICLERGADLHMAQLMPLPLTVSCFSKIQIGFTFLVPAHPGGPGQGPLNGSKWVLLRVGRRGSSGGWRAHAGSGTLSAYARSRLCCGTGDGAVPRGAAAVAAD